MKSGFVTIVGRVNVGKSTLLNNILNKKVSIVSSKPATTRIKILGIYNCEEGQIIFIDTPGIEKWRNQLGKFMQKMILSSIDETDIILFLIDAKGWREEDEKILEVLKKANKKIILVINKIDLLKDKEELLPLIDELNKKYEFLDIVPISALKKQNVDRLIKVIISHLPEGEKFYPSDVDTNLPTEYKIGEIIREKILEKTHQEVPQEVAVEVEEIREGQKNKDVIFISANIIVERDNLKGIIIGKGGERIRKIGQLAREEIEFLLGKNVYLQLKVKVIKDWRNRPDIFRRFGYGIF